MEKLSMCRICLAENVLMYVVVNETLHDLYEKLTDIPFVTEDSRPTLACFICCAQLKKCFRLMKKCLDAEEQFAKMMMINEEYEIKPLINQDQFELFHGFIRTPIDTISIVDVDQTENIVVKEELPAVCERLDDIIETKEEHESDDDIKTINIYDNYMDIEFAPLHHSESDSDDVPLLEVKKEGEAEKTSGPPAVKKQETDTRKTKLTDIITTKQKKEDTKMIQDIQNRTSESYIAKNQKVQNRISKFKQKVALTQPKDTREKPFKCDFCQRSFTQKFTLIKHIIRKHPDEKPFKCDVCQYSFREKDALKQHRLSHGENPFKCDVCSHTFRFKCDFTRHIRKHTGEKPFKCDFCQKTFRLKATLVSHIYNHTGDKPFQCDICQSNFSYKTSLTRHSFSHTGEKPFECHICQRTFSRKSSLTTHIPKHTGEKPFQCHICQSCFSWRSTLTRHINRHC